MQNYDKLHTWLKTNTTPEEYTAILNIYLKILDRTRTDIPLDIQDYWIKNQDKLELTGKFLPDDSALIGYKK